MITTALSLFLLASVFVPVYMVVALAGPAVGLTIPRSVDSLVVLGGVALMLASATAVAAGFLMTAT